MTTDDQQQRPDETTPDGALGTGPDTPPFEGSGVLTAPPVPRTRWTRRRIGIAAASAALAVVALTGGSVALAAQRGSGSTAVAAAPAAGGLAVDRGRHGYATYGGDGSSTDGSVPGTSGGSGTSGGTTGGSLGTSQGTLQGGGTTETTSVATAAQEVGLVEITSTLTNGTSAGTGMILSSTGEIVTNHHVVEGATAIKVTVVSTGRSYTARYVGSSSTADVAVIQLQGASGLTPVTVAGSAVTVGTAVTSVGDAGGDGGTLTAAPGTVSAENQDITVQGDDGTASQLTGLVELAADIVPGDSGGAVLDAAGQVVGMNVAASSGTTDVTGYAIPISTVMSVVDAVEAGTSSSTISLGYDGYLGIGLASSTSSPVVYGVVAGGPAATAGIASGDTITSVGGTAVSSAQALHDAVAAHDPGAKVAVTWTTTSGATHSATVTLGEAPIA